MSDEAILHIWTGRELRDWNIWVNQVSAALNEQPDKEKCYDFANKHTKIRDRMRVIRCGCGYQTPIGTEEWVLRNQYFDGHECVTKTVIPTMPGMVD